MTLAKDQDWTIYYLDSEAYAADAFKTITAALGPWAEPGVTNFDTTLDFACGYGRLGPFFAKLAKKVIFADIRADAVEMCRKRFSTYKNSFVHGSHLSQVDFEFIQNTEENIPLADGSVDFIYSWDAMVHLEYLELTEVIREFARILKPGGRGLAHHSNLRSIEPEERMWSDNHGSRSWVSADEVAEMLTENGLQVFRQVPHDRGLPGLDTITTFEKPR